MPQVYQMIVAPNADGELGLMFASELINNSDNDNTDGNIASTSLMVFALPINHRSDLFDLEYSFPGMVNGEYNEFPLSFNREISMLEVKGFRLNNKIPISLRFKLLYLPSQLDELELIDDELYRVPRYYYTDPLKYFGNNNIITREQLFLPFIPIDIILMDILYLEQKICLVGRTPVFGVDNQLLAIG